MADHAPGLRSSFLRVMNLIPADGIRLTDLATRASMTKQAMGEFVATLEQEGFVRVLADPHDRRVRLVTPTPRGIELQKASAAAIEELEREWRERVGPRRWATTCAVLAELGR
ncbi:MarR family transcriptional regulator [Sphaerisporangium perillae]|uniref:MarR family transcriptional regulator n=1 Tax=Sphaerisporangium perillae TaxID=2935860 RepID=UPI00200E5BE1|nr:MarR family transcriptional regulator [Sphaerisporangium perillae]